MTTETAYDPKNIEQHAGKVYRTTNEEVFFNENARFYLRGTKPRNSVEGTTPEMIAGINPEYKEKLKLIFGGQQRHGLVEFLKQCGEAPAPGKLLVLALSHEDARAKDRIGFYTTSPLEEIK